MNQASDLHKKWSRDPEYQEAYEALGLEFELARSVIEARTRAGLTQEQLARRMGTTQSVIARLESGRVCPSTKTLESSPRPRAHASRSASSRPRTPPDCTAGLLPGLESPGYLRMAGRPPPQ